MIRQSPALASAVRGKRATQLQALDTEAELLTYGVPRTAKYMHSCRMLLQRVLHLRSHCFDIWQTFCWYLQARWQARSVRLS